MDQRSLPTENSSPATASSPAKKLPLHFGALDGLRGIAILAVLAHHYGNSLLTGTTPLRRAVLTAVEFGGMGVDLFFALSGFLITGILYDMKDQSHFFRRFYWRRSLRIFPPFYVLLLACLPFRQMFDHVRFIWFAAYLRNWRPPDYNSDFFLGHLWSLGVEEQFYIFWAIAVFFCPRKRLPWLMAGLSVFALVFRSWMFAHGYSQYQMMRFTLSRIDALLLGGLVAIGYREWNWKIVRRASWVLGLLALAGFTLVNAFDGGKLFNAIARISGASLSAMMFAALVAVSLDVKLTSLAGHILHSAFLRNIAKYSYAMYLFHLAPHELFHASYLRFADHHPAWTVPLKLAYIPIMSAVVYGMARLSWRYVEAPCLRLKDRYPDGPSFFYRGRTENAGTPAEP